MADGSSPLPVDAVLKNLALSRPIFHSEADFQHALAWELQRWFPEARIRLEVRPERAIHLDLLVTIGTHRTALELKHLSAAFHGSVLGEIFDIPKTGAHDICRYDVWKDVVRLEKLLADGFADDGWAIVLTSDGGYWRPGWKPDPIDAAFRLQEGRQVSGPLAWGDRAGTGTTRGREAELPVRGSYECRWAGFSQVDRTPQPLEVRYLALRANLPVAPPVVRERPGSAF